MDFVTPLYHALQAQATLDQTAATALDTRALAQMRQQAVQMGAIRMQQMQNTQQAFTQALSGQNLSDPSLDASPNDTPVESANKEVGRMQRQADFARRMSMTVMQLNGDPKVADVWNDNATNASWRETQARRQLLSAQKDLATHVSSIAAAVTPENFGVSYQQLAQADPKMIRNLSAANGFDLDPYGAPTWGPKTQQTMQILKNSGITAEDQAKNAIKIQDEKDRVVREQRLAADEVRKQQATDADIAVKREHGKLLQAQTDQIRQGKSAKGLTVPEQRTNAEIDQARQEVSTLSPELAAKYFDPFTPESLRNPRMTETLKKAATLKYGDDPDYAATRAKFSPTAQAPKPAGATAAPSSARSVSGKITTAAAPGGEAALPMPATKDGLKQNAVYNTVRGPARWNGTAFEPL